MHVYTESAPLKLDLFHFKLLHTIENTFEFTNLHHISVRKTFYIFIKAHNPFINFHKAVLFSIGKRKHHNNANMNLFEVVFQMQV